MQTRAEQLIPTPAHGAGLRLIDADRTRDVDQVEMTDVMRICLDLLEQMSCDHRLRDALDTLADASRRHNPWAADIYQRARARGAGTHPRLLLEPDHLGLWHDHDTCDPSRHTASERLIAAGG